jgi:hypothetical protein
VTQGLWTIEALMWIYSAGYLALTGYEFYLQRSKLFVDSLKLNPSKFLLILSFLFSLLQIPFRLGCVPDAEDHLTILSILFKSSYVLYLGRGFKRITTFVYVIHQVAHTSFLQAYRHTSLFRAYNTFYSTDCFLFLSTEIPNM